jgi:membrane protein DedA with SNARE-associated domain
MSFFQEGSGYWVVGAGRVIPGIRTYVSVPAGLSHMSLVPYIIFSSIGTVIWTGLLAIAGYFLGDRFEEVQAYISPISKIVLISLAVSAVIWIVRRYSRRQQS